MSLHSRAHSFALLLLLPTKNKAAPSIKAEKVRKWERAREWELMLWEEKKIEGMDKCVVCALLCVGFLMILKV